MGINCYKDAEKVINRCHPLAKRVKDSEIIEKYQEMVKEQAKYKRRN